MASGPKLAKRSPMAVKSQGNGMRMFKVAAAANNAVRAARATPSNITTKEAKRSRSFWTCSIFQCQSHSMLAPKTQITAPSKRGSGP